MPGPQAVVGAKAPIERVFGDLRFHTDGEVHGLAFADDRVLWSVEQGGVLRQWNTDTGQQLGYSVLSDLETLWQFRGDAKLLVSASDDLSLWDVASGQMLAVLPLPSWVTAVTFRQNTSWVATGHDDGTVRLWDVPGKKLVREFSGHKMPVSALAFSADGNRLASAGEDRDIVLWDVDAGKQIGAINTGHFDRISGLAWHPRGDRLVSAGWDTTARVWNVATCEPIILLNSHADLVTAIAFSPDGSLLACADSAHTVHLWTTEPIKEIHVLREHEAESRVLAFSPNSRLLASGGADGAICLWDAKLGRLLSGSGDQVQERTNLAVGPDGKWLASSRGGAGVKVWDTANGQTKVELEGQPLAPILAASPDGTWLAGGADNTIAVWNVQTGKRACTIDEQRGDVAALAFAPDSLTLASASASDGLVWLYNVTTGEPVLVIPEAADNCIVETLAFHPSGRLLAAGGIDWLATGGSDGAVCLWDVKERCRVANFDGGTTAIAFHPSGRWLAVASLAQSVLVWNIEEQKMVAELAGHGEAITSVAYSPDGRWLATGSDDRTLRLWNTATGQLAATRELETQIKALCFAADGRFLFTGNGNATAYQFDVRRLLAE